MSDRPVGINRLEVNGAKNTSEWLLETHFRPLLDSQAPDMTSFVEALHARLHHLSQLGIFKSMDVLLDAPSDLSATGDVVPVDVIVRVEERPRFFLKTGTEFSKNEASLAATGVVRNVFGNAEIFQLTYGRGTRTSAAIDAQFRKPLKANPLSVIEVNGFQDEQDWTEQSSSHQLNRGVTLKWKLTTSSVSSHEIGMSMSWRQLTNLHEKASLSIREAAGHSFKNSISSKLVYDLRDNPFVPTKGAVFRLENEVAGLGWGVKFVKSSAETQWCRSFFGKKVTANLSLKSGLLYSLDGTSSIHDRFQLGGPGTVRGFKIGGIGPRASKDELRQDSTGGDAFWAAGLSVFSPFPFLSRWDFLKMHTFINAGSLIPFQPTSNMLDAPKTLYQSFANNPVSASFGIGLLARMSVARLELNIAWPWARANNDVLAGTPSSKWPTAPRFQVGIGMEFL